MKKIILGKCECGGDIVEKDTMAIHGEETYDAMLAICEKCGFDWTDELE